MAGVEAQESLVADTVCTPAPFAAKSIRHVAKKYVERLLRVFDALKVMSPQEYSCAGDRNENTDRYTADLPCAGCGVRFFRQGA